MAFDSESDPEINFDAFRNEFTGAARESLKAPEPQEPICLISYEISFILLGGGPQDRPSFWRTYRRELALNLETDYRNYHVGVCRHQLVSLRVKPNGALYFRNNRLTTEKPLDPSTIQVLTDPHFNSRPTR